MATFKVRRLLTAQGGIKVGAGGDTVSEVLFGVVSACVPGITASGDVDSGSMAITGLNAGAKVMLIPTNSSVGLIVYSACATAAGQVSASYCSATGATVNASTLQFAYIAFA